MACFVGTGWNGQMGPFSPRVESQLPHGKGNHTNHKEAKGVEGYGLIQ